MQGSPYVDEGLWDRIKARGSAGTQQLRGIINKGWTPLDERKIESLWNSYTNKVGVLIKDFNNNVVPNIKAHRKEDLTLYKDDILKFKALGKFFIPKAVSQPRKKVAPSTTATAHGMYPPSTVAPDDFSGTYGWTSSPNLYEIINEASFSSLYLPISIVRAKASNNTKLTIDAYKNEFKRMYEEFIRDASKVLKLTNVEVDKAIATKKPKWNPFLKSWKNAAGIPIEVIPPETNKPVEPPDVATGKVPTPATPETKPHVTSPSTFSPKIVGEPPPMDPSKYTYSSSSSEVPPPQDKSTKTSKQSSEKSTEQEKVGEVYINTEIIRKVIDLVINVIKSDPKSRKYFNKDLSSWKWTGGKTDVPDVTHTNLNENDPVDEPETDDIGSDPTHKEKFLYKFRALYSKYTGNFVIDLGVFKHNDITYEVQWHSFGAVSHSHGHNNEINVNVYVPENNIPNKEDQKYKTYHITLFSFYDHEIDPRTLVGKKFSIKNIFTEANPTLAKKITSEAETMFNSKQDEFHKALFAVTDRKSMEHQVHLPPVGKAARDRLMPEEGWNEDKATTYIQRAIILLGSKGSTSEMLVARAKKIRESEELLAAKMWNIDVTRKYLDKAIKQVGLDDVTAQVIAQRAISLRQEDLDMININPIKQDPRYKDLVGAMVNLGYKQQESEEYVENFLKTQKIPNDISMQDLIFSLAAALGRRKEGNIDETQFINPFVSDNFL